MANVADSLARRGVPKNEFIKLEDFKKWRVVINDTIEGLVVIDIEGEDEADAKNKADSAARQHLKCKNITGITAMNWVVLPDAWKRIGARRI